MQINKSSILIDVRNALGENIRGTEARFFLYNQRLRSLDCAFRVKLGTTPILLADVPAFPFGAADLVMSIDRYHGKKHFVNVAAGEALELQEVFLLDAGKAKVKFPSLRHPAFEKLNGAASELSDLQKAGLLNIHAKLASLDLADAVGTVEQVLPSRIFARVDDQLLDQLRESPDLFSPVSGVSHSFPKPWKRIETLGSFKTREAQGNLQVTFASNGDNQLLADIDIDDNRGVAHAFDVLGHALTGADTHPYNIHQILLALQGIDPGYKLS
jgi:hypothetical protein